MIAGGSEAASLPGVEVDETTVGGHINRRDGTCRRAEVAAVGETEESLQDRGLAYRVVRFLFMGNGRANAVFAGDGFVKLLADREADRILGAHVIRPGAGDLIHEICAGMEFGAPAADVERTCDEHPTFSEALREAALALGDGPIHA